MADIFLFVLLELLARTYIQKTLCRYRLHLLACTAEEHHCHSEKQGSMKRSHTGHRSRHLLQLVLVSPMTQQVGLVYRNELK